MNGTHFGRYRLVELLGRGGMGEVWRAYDTETKRIVAIKVLPPHLADNNEFARRFRREAEAAAQLNSPHVIPIHHYGEIDGRLYVDMRLIAGRDLGTVLADGPLEPARAVRIIDQVAKALHTAHKVGLLHRDIKPSNVLLDDDDFAYLIDFGIARAADETRLTKSGNMIGTFAYIAPERLDGRGEEDARVDIYSLACLLYECLTGERPFPDDTMPRLIVAHLNTPPPRPSITRPDVPAQVDEVIATGMAKEPNQRYATTVELAEAARDAITTPLAPPNESTVLAGPARTAPPPQWPPPAPLPKREPPPRPPPVPLPKPEPLVTVDSRFLDPTQRPPPIPVPKREPMQWNRVLIWGLVIAPVEFVLMWLWFRLTADTPWLALLGIVTLFFVILGAAATIVGFWRWIRWDNSADGPSGTAPRSTLGAPDAAPKSTKVMCNQCRHVQTVPVSRQTFTCDRCGTRLKRRTTPAKAS